MLAVCGRLAWGLPAYRLPGERLFWLMLKVVNDPAADDVGEEGFLSVFVSESAALVVFLGSARLV